MQILSQRRVQLPDAVAFAALEAVEAPWPTESRRDLEYRWLGYDLDTQQLRTRLNIALGGVLCWRFLLAVVKTPKLNQ